MNRNGYGTHTTVQLLNLIADRNLFNGVTFVLSSDFHLPDINQLALHTFLEVRALRMDRCFFHSSAYVEDHDDGEPELAADFLYACLRSGLFSKDFTDTYHEWITAKSAFDFCLGPAKYSDRNKKRQLLLGWLSDMTTENFEEFVKGQSRCFNQLINL